MPQVSHQGSHLGDGLITLTNAQQNLTFDIPIHVNRANCLFRVFAHEGNTQAIQSQFNAEINANGETIEITRQTASITQIVLGWEIYEHTGINSYPLKTTITGAATPQAIGATVDLDRSFVVVTGTAPAVGTSRSDQTTGYPKIDSTTTVEVVGDANNTAAIISYQVIELDASLVSSVKHYEIEQDETPKNQTITSVDVNKTLLFPAVFSTAAMTNNEVPRYELTSATNLRATSESAQVGLISSVYVVEFANLVVTHDTELDLAGTSHPIALGASQTNPSINLNSPMGQWGATEDTFNSYETSTFLPTFDSVTDTWTLTRQTAAAVANLSYSTFDWSTLDGASLPQNVGWISEEIYSSSGVLAEGDVTITVYSDFDAEAVLIEPQTVTLASGIGTLDNDLFGSVGDTVDIFIEHTDGKNILLRDQTVVDLN